MEFKFQSLLPPKFATSGNAVTGAVGVVGVVGVVGLVVVGGVTTGGTGA
jgi:hypothetical protein